MRRPRRSVVRTPGFHPGNGGSIPLGVAIKIECVIQRVVTSRPLFYWWMNGRYGLYWGMICLLIIIPNRERSSFDNCTSSFARGF